MQMLAEEDKIKLLELQAMLDTIDGLPTLTPENRNQFVTLYKKAKFTELIPYLAQLMAGLNYYGVSICLYVLDI